MNRPASARLHSLCGTARRMKKKQERTAARETGVARQPCREAGLWACHGDSERFRRRASATR